MKQEIIEKIIENNYQMLRAMYQSDDKKVQKLKVQSDTLIKDYLENGRKIQQGRKL